MSGQAELILRDSSGVEKPIRRVGDAMYAALFTALAGERNIGSGVGSYLAVQNDWTITELNPHTATTGTTLTAGAAGNTEILVTAAPCTVGAIVMAADTAAGNLLLRDAAATGLSVAPRSFNSVANTSTVYLLGGAKFLNGLTAIGTVAGLSCMIFWKAT